MQFFKRILNWLRQLFAGAKQPTIAAPAAIRKEIAPVVEISRQPGLSCPDCGTRIPVSINALLQSDPAICPNCRLVLELDVQQSQGALEALQRLQNGLEAAGKKG